MPRAKARDRAGASLEEMAPAKVNLFLHVVGRRSDGLHLLDSLVVFADFGDRLTLEIAPAEEPVLECRSLIVTGRFASALHAELSAGRKLSVETAHEIACAAAAPRCFSVDFTLAKEL